MKTEVVDKRSGSRQVRVFNGGEHECEEFVRDTRDVHLDVIAGDDGVLAIIDENRLSATRTKPRRFAPTAIDIVWRREHHAADGADVGGHNPWRLTVLMVQGFALKADGSMGTRRVTNNYRADRVWAFNLNRYEPVPVPEWLKAIVAQHDPNQGWPLENVEV